MKIGALIVTTGLAGVSGIAALMPNIGTVPAGQRMIAAFRRAGVSRIGLVVGPEDKKTERQFAQNSVIFLRCKKETTFFGGVKQGLSFLQGKYQRIFVVPGDISLFLPHTLNALLETNASIAVPVNKYVHGCPVLLSDAAIDWLLLADDTASLEQAIAGCPLEKAFVDVEDAGVLLRGRDMTYRKELIRLQDRQLTHPVAEVALSRDAPFWDPKLSLLLHLVDDTRSVRLACSLMQISYSAAWNMLNRVEDALGYPLVIRIRGGAAGSGSALTERGIRMMEAYDKFSDAVNQKAQTLYDTFFRDLPELN